MRLEYDSYTPHGVGVCASVSTTSAHPTAFSRPFHGLTAVPLTLLVVGPGRCQPVCAMFRTERLCPDKSKPLDRSHRQGMRSLADATVMTLPLDVLEKTPPSFSLPRFLPSRQLHSGLLTLWRPRSNVLRICERAMPSNLRLYHACGETLPPDPQVNHLPALSSPFRVLG